VPRITIDDESFEWLENIIDQVVATVEQEPSKYTFSLTPVKKIQGSLKASKKIEQKHLPRQEQSKDVDIIDNILRAKRAFNVSQMSDRLNVPVNKLRPILKELVQDNKIETFQLQTSGRGRGPTMYRVRK
jgi:hypothetical protein